MSVNFKIRVIKIETQKANTCDYERDSGDFKLKVGIPFFSGNLNIEDFID